MAVRFHKPIKFKFSREREYRPTITSSLGGFPEEFSFLSSLGLTYSWWSRGCSGKVEGFSFLVVRSRASVSVRIVFFN